MSLKNRQILLASRPEGEPTPENFRLVEVEVPQPGPGQMLLRTLYLSLDPYMRGRMNAGPSAGSSFRASLPSDSAYSCQPAGAKPTSPGL